MDRVDYDRLPGNPNNGKSTVFNNLTDGRQHTGNRAGKPYHGLKAAIPCGKAIKW